MLETVLLPIPMLPVRPRVKGAAVGLRLVWCSGDLMEVIAVGRNSCLRFISPPVHRLLCMRQLIMIIRSCLYAYLTYFKYGFIPNPNVYLHVFFHVNHARHSPGPSIDPAIQAKSP